MFVRRILGLAPDADGSSGSGDGDGQRASIEETATMRRIVAQLEALPADERRHLAGFAYILSRAAHADLEITDDETRAMERIIVDIGGLAESQAVLVVQIAKSQTQHHGGTEDYLVTREFRLRTDEAQRMAVLRSCFVVSAVNGSISAEEYAELGQIATELGFTREQLNEVRSEYHDQFAAIQAMRAMRSEEPQRDEVD